MTELYLHAARKTAGIRLHNIVGDLSDAEKLVADRACVYATGSFGRLEASTLSDLDLFIVVDTAADQNTNEEKPLIGGIEEIKLKCQLIDAAQRNGIKKFDGDGKYLASHTIESYTKWLGSNEDDYRNTLTGRMLLLLESKPLIGSQLYEKVIDRVIDKYFRDYEGHEDNFVPSFLINDILRMWRTFCVNYEFYRKDGDSRNKIKNLKLKFSRMLTCYSGILYLLAVQAKQHTVHPRDVRGMVNISPTERLEAIAGDGFWEKGLPNPSIRDASEKALLAYSEFLQLTHQDVRKAVAEYRRAENVWREKSYDFGETLSSLVDALGEISPASGRLRRLIII